MRTHTLLVVAVLVAAAAQSLARCDVETDDAPLDVASVDVPYNQHALVTGYHPWSFDYVAARSVGSTDSPLYFGSATVASNGSLVQGRFEDNGLTSVSFRFVELDTADVDSDGLVDVVGVAVHSADDAAAGVYILFGANPAASGRAYFDPAGLKPAMMTVKPKGSLWRSVGARTYGGVTDVVACTNATIYLWSGGMVLSEEPVIVSTHLPGVHTLSSVAFGNFVPTSLGNDLVFVYDFTLVRVIDLVGSAFVDVIDSPLAIAQSGVYAMAYDANADGVDDVVVYSGGDLEAYEEDRGLWLFLNALGFAPSTSFNFAFGPGARLYSTASDNVVVDAVFVADTDSNGTPDLNLLLSSGFGPFFQFRSVAISNLFPLADPSVDTLAFISSTVDSGDQDPASPGYPLWALNMYFPVTELADEPNLRSQAIAFPALPSPSGRAAVFVVSTSSNAYFSVAGGVPTTQVDFGAFPADATGNVFETFTAPIKFHPGDIDGDLFDDILVSNGGFLAVVHSTIFDLTGSSSFNFATDFQNDIVTIPRAYLLDVDSNGDVDVVYSLATNVDGTPPPPPPGPSPPPALFASLNYKARVFFQLQADNSFDTYEYSTAPLFVRDFVLGDIDASGTFSLVVSVMNATGFRPPGPDTAILVVPIVVNPNSFTNRITFGPAVGLPTPSLPSPSYIAAGLELVSTVDGALNVVVVWASTTSYPVFLTVFSELDTTVVATTRPVPPIGSSPPATFTTTCAGDLDGDGNDDLVVGTTGSRVVVAHLEGGDVANVTEFVALLDPLEAISPPPPFISATALASVVIADMNGDGRNDIVLAGNGAFNDQAVVAIAYATNQDLRLVGSADVYTLWHDVIDFDHNTGATIVVADFDRNGVLDLVVSQYKSIAPAPAPTFSGARTLGLVAQVPLVLHAPRPTVHEVDVRRCGYNMRCVAAALRAAPTCQPAIVKVPNGVYEGCFDNSLAITVDSASMILVPSNAAAPDITFSCTRSGGVLFLAPSQDGALWLESVAIEDTYAQREVSLGTSALRIAGGAAILSNVTMSGCRAPLISAAFSLSGYGGALLVDQGGSAWVVDSVFVQNSATEAGGAMSLMGDSALYVSRTSFVSNTAEGLGGAVMVGGGRGQVTVVDCTFEENVSVHGGAVAVSGREGAAEVALHASTFADNRAMVGGCVALTSAVGGTSNFMSTVISVTSSTFVRNSAMYGGVAGLVGTPFLDSSAGVEVTALPRGTSPGFLPQLGMSGIPLVKFDSCAFDSNVGTYGGVVFTCGVPSAFESSTQVVLGAASQVTTAVAGGFGFACLPQYDAGNPATRYFGPLPSFPWTYVDGVTAGQAATSAAGVGIKWGAMFATPPTELRFVAGASQTVLDERVYRVTIESGVAVRTLAGVAHPQVVALDALGLVVVDSVRVVTTPTPGQAFTPSLAEGPSVSFLSTGGVSLLPIGVALPRGAWGSDATGRPVGTMQFVVDGSTNIGTVDVEFELTACGPFDAGRTSEASDVAPLVCSDCVYGTYAEALTLDECVSFPDCGPDAERAVGNVTIVPGKVPGASYITALPCACVVGFYAPGGVVGATGCAACPNGGVCAGGLAQPLADEGWYDVSETGDGSAFAACQRPGACPGGAVGLCHTGYEGYMCNTCTTGYYTNANGGCTKCPSLSVRALLVLVLVAAGVALVVGTLFMIAGSRMNRGPKNAVQRSRKVPYALSSATIFLQIVAIVGTADYSWPSSFSSTTSAVASVANLDFNVFATECSTASFAGKYLLAVLLPLGFALVFVLCAVVAKFVLRVKALADVSLLRAAERGLFLLGPLLYIPLSRTSLILFDCTAEPGRNGYTLDADQGVKCFEAEWWSLLPAGIVAVVLYVVLVPGFIAYQLYTHRDTLYEPATFAHLGSVYRLYRRQYFYFELVQLFRRLSIVVAALFLSQLQLLQFAILFTVFGSSLVFQVARGPYYNTTYNELEARLSGILVCLILVGAAFYADKFPNRGSEHLFIFLSFACLGGGVAVLAYALFRELSERQQGVDPTAKRVAALQALLARESGDWPELTAVIDSLPAPGQGADPSSVALDTFVNPAPISGSGLAVNDDVFANDAVLVGSSSSS